MSKYAPLWKWVSVDGAVRGMPLTVSFSDIEKILGFPIDASFPAYKGELEPFGFCVGEISMQNGAVTFDRIK